MLKQDDVSCFNSLCHSRNPWEDIPNNIWSRWAIAIRQDGKQNLKIYDLAREIEENWPWTRRNETIDDYLDIWPVTMRDAIAGMGRKKIRTLILCVAHLALFKCNENKEFPVEHNDASFSDKMLSYDELSGLTNQNDSDASDDNQIKFPQALLVEMLSHLKKIERDVILKRYCDGDKKCTLGDIATTLSLTRERVRQIERNAFEKIQNLDKYELLKKSIGLVGENYFRELSGGESYLSNDNLSTIAQSKLGGYIIICIKACYGDLTSWLSSFCLNFEHWWLLGEGKIDEITDNIKRIIDFFEIYPYPMPLSTVEQYTGLSKACIGRICTISKNLYSYGGYIGLNPLNISTKRAIGLTSLVPTRHNGWMTIYELSDKYQTQFTSDIYGSPRMLEMAMESTPHLFIKCGEGRWLSNYDKESKAYFDKADIEKLAQYNIVADIEKDENNNINDHSVLEAIVAILEANGPSRIAEIRDEFVSSYGHLYSVNSCTTLLLTRSEFYRLAPGIYGLVSDLNNLDPVMGFLPILLDDKSLRNYVMARYAGEEMNSYPAWTPAMEREWAKWATKHASIELYKSFLYIANPSTWDVSDTINKFWLEEKTKYQNYLLEFPSNFNLPLDLPTLLDVLKVCRYMQIVRKINWVAINRVIGKVIDDKSAASMLAILIALDLISPESTWQESHNVTELIDKFVDKITSRLFISGKLDWNDEFGASVVSQLSTHCNSTLGWLSRSQLSNIIKYLKGHAPKAERTIDLSNVENIMELLGLP